MSARPATAAKSTKALNQSTHRPFDIAGVLLFALAIVAVVALVTPDSGLIGSSLGFLVKTLFGTGAWVVPFLLGILGVAFIRGRSLAVTHLTWGLSVLFLAVLGFLAVERHGDFFDPAAITEGGGYLGAMVGWLFYQLLGTAQVVGLGALALVGLILSVDVPIRTMLSAPKQAVVTVRQRTLERPRRPKPVREEKPVRATPAPERRSPERPPDAVPESVAPSRKAPKIREVELNREPVEAAAKEGYELPSTNLLAEPILNPARSHAEMQRNIETLEGTLEQFGIEASVVEVATGPTVTRYEIQLGPGIRVNRITALADNIAMDLAASMVRVEAPIPGKAAIGVEVPNTQPAVVSLRELCEDPLFKNHSSRLCTALGKDVSGVNRYADLTRMPHLLIGGATNAGKSIGLASLITSLLMRNTPKDVRLVMIDPKRVELTLFDGIPHLMCPVIKDVKEAPGVLRAIWREMDRRYDLFSEAGVRNIDGWNSKASFQDKLPYIVVVVDELADLMIQAKAEIETIIVRLAQLARAVGIHLVIATQRPSVDVITGLIKANIPSRIAFAVPSHIDSRTIIDQKGAEALIGKGDMLYSPIGANAPVRVQGCYVSEKEIEAICNHWRQQERPQYVLQPVEEGVADARKEGGDFGETDDPLWEDAVRWAVDRGQASTSMLQRKFSIGFQRASRLLDMMEEKNIVGPRDGPRPREVLMNPMDVDALFGKGPVYDVGRTIADEEAEFEEDEE
ncbi:MAG TPA: DNA translocase FtsK [Fimbriimonas sp.]